MKGTQRSLPEAITPGKEGERGWSRTPARGGGPLSPRELTGMRELRNPAPPLPLFLETASD